MQAMAIVRLAADGEGIAVKAMTTVSAPHQTVSIPLRVKADIEREHLERQLWVDGLNRSRGREACQAVRV